jgi:hypothetical protein
VRNPLHRNIFCHDLTVRALASIAALPLFGTLGVEELVEVGRRAHALAELRQSSASRVPQWSMMKTVSVNSALATRR